MDCRAFRKQHLAYLDDTLPGAMMAEAQCHILSCDRCAAHDTMVRRSLMMVHSLPEIEPSAAFESRLQARLAECRARGEPSAGGHDDDAFLDGLDGMDDARPHRVRRSARILLAMAAGVTVFGTVALRASGLGESELELAPVLAAAPRTPAPIPTMVSPELVQAMATGNPMWSMTLLLDNAPAHFLSTAGVLASDFR